MWQRLAEETQRVYADDELVLKNLLEQIEINSRVAAEKSNDIALAAVALFLAAVAVLITIILFTFGF